MLTYATEVMGSIEIFIDKVLDAFAADRPARAGGPLPPWTGPEPRRLEAWSRRMFKRFQVSLSDIPENAGE
jgi:hypothetical protein